MDDVASTQLIHNSWGLRVHWPPCPLPVPRPRQDPRRFAIIRRHMSRRNPPPRLLIRGRLVARRPTRALETFSVKIFTPHLIPRLYKRRLPLRPCQAPEQHCACRPGSPGGAGGKSPGPPVAELIKLAGSSLFSVARRMATLTILPSFSITTLIPMDEAARL